MHTQNIKERRICDIVFVCTHEEKRIPNNNNNKWIEPNKNNSDILSKCRTYMGKWNQNRKQYIFLYHLFSKKKEKKKKESNISFYMLKNAISFLIHHARWIVSFQNFVTVFWRPCRHCHYLTPSYSVDCTVVVFN